MNVATRGVRNAFRNVIRTASIVVILGLIIGLSLAMLVARQAVDDKISSVQASVGNTVTVSPAGVRGFEGGGNALTETKLAALKKLTHVTSVDETLQDRLTSENTNLKSAVEAGDLGKRFAQNGGTFRMAAPGGSAPDIQSFTPPVSLRGTTNPTDLSEGGGTFTLKSGKTFAGSSSDNVALVGNSLATKNNLTVGSTFTAYGKTITVAGIFDAGNTFGNNQVLMPLKTLQTLSDQADDVTGATVHVDSVTNIDSVTTAVKKALGADADVTNGAEQAKQTIEPLNNIKTVTMYSLVGAVAAGAVIILLTMVMIVRERRREIGVIKAIGASNLKVMLQFMTEAVTLTTLGAIIGIAIGAAAANPITKMLVDSSSDNGPTLSAGGPGRTIFRGVGDNFSSIHAAVGWDILLYGFGAALLIAIVGSAIASYFIAKVRPAEVMRAE
ncbi:MAG TPA: FtsX-like permease family protein [Nevskiaceae bacterium]|nr:FtsX-like permease family protein [Nevskiaceae bacterium]